MSADEFEKRFQRHVEFMLEQQVRFDARQALFQERQVQFEQRQALFEERLSRLEQVQEQQGENINRLINEMREGFNRLIAVDELTNSLIEKLTHLEVQNSQRLTNVEQRIDKREEKTS
jgi:hypothetical protein